MSNQPKEDNNSPTAVVLLSGGIDSAACVCLLLSQGYKVRGLFFDYGQLALPYENKAAESIAQHLNIDLIKYKIPSSNPRGAGEQFARNPMFVFMALFLERYSTGNIALGIHAGTPYYDCSEVFMRRMDTLLTELSDGHLKLMAPFLQWSKAEIVAYAKTVKLPISLTYSCEAGTEHHCGKCPSCLDRKALDLL